MDELTAQFKQAIDYDDFHEQRFNVKGEGANSAHINNNVNTSYHDSHADVKQESSP